MSKYRGIVFDIDETIVPNGALRIESKAVVDVFAGLPSDVIAIAATGRKHSSAFPIIKPLNLKHDSVIANGAQIINSSSGEITYSQNLSLEQVKLINNICKTLKYNQTKSKNSLNTKIYRPSSCPILILHNIQPKNAYYLIENINTINNVHAYLAPAWDNPKNFDIGIGHIKAKKHVAIEVLYKKYNLNPNEVIGVGDGMNDIELFNAVGHKIAVANANPKLLEQADEIVPSQKDNGIITVINKYFS